MTKKTKTLLYSSITALLVGLTIWYFVARDKGNGKNGRKGGNGRNGRTGCKQPQWSGCNDNFPVKMGSCGQKVAELQSYIVSKEGRSVIKVDGKFGCITLGYAEKYFPGRNLQRDGLTASDFNTINIYFVT